MSKFRTLRVLMRGLAVFVYIILTCTQHTEKRNLVGQLIADGHYAAGRELS